MVTCGAGFVAANSQSTGYSSEKTILAFNRNVWLVSVCILENMKKFSIDELRSFDGTSGRPAYVGYRGKVYDVTGSDQWVDGDHMGHVAGQDLTEDMDIAPHADDVMEKMKVVGVLSGS